MTISIKNYIEYVVNYHNIFDWLDYYKNRFMLEYLIIQYKKSHHN